jgi:hypothetical protein
MRYGTSAAYLLRRLARDHSDNGGCAVRFRPARRYSLARDLLAPPFADLFHPNLLALDPRFAQQIRIQVELHTKYSAFAA